ncbi:helix-turn-helix domain-containing protein [Oxalobacteraceae bacterium A2-2]
MGKHIPLHTLPVRGAPVRCGGCALRALCLAAGLDAGELARLEHLIRRRRVVRDQQLFRMGEPGQSLYVVRFGHFKTTQADRRGASHVTGFQMAGDVLGMDAVGNGVHASAAMALEDAEVCEIPYARLNTLLPEAPRLLERFHHLLGRELLRVQAAMMFLGNMRADQRLASFLLDLGGRYAQRGFSPRSFQLRMSREDMASYLGLTIECVSRQLASLRQHGWIALERRAVELSDRAALVALTAGLQPALPEPDAAPAHAA